MKPVFTYYSGRLDDFVAIALITTKSLVKTIIASVDMSLVSLLVSNNIMIDESYHHTIDNNAVRHIINCHGNDSELLRGQLPLCKCDLLHIPNIIIDYYTIEISNNRRGQAVISYTKTIGDDMYYYIEEVRYGRHELAACTLYKRKKDDSPTLIG